MLFSVDCEAEDMNCVLGCWNGNIAGSHSVDEI